MHTLCRMTMAWAELCPTEFGRAKPAIASKIAMHPIGSTSSTRVGPARNPRAKCNAAVADHTPKTV